MCLILLAIETSPDYPLIVAANRDEFHERPAAAAHFWRDHPQLLAGRDLQQGGTWMGITLDGRFAAVTNFREQTPPSNPRSRGELTNQFLLGDDSPRAYLERVAAHAGEFRGFNLIVGTHDQGYFYYSNRTQELKALASGVYGLSNDTLNAPWPKVVHGIRVLSASAHDPSTDALLEHLTSRDVPTDGEPEHVGPDPEASRRAASTFIDGAVYGTRSSTVMIQNGDGWVDFTEQCFRAAGEKSTASSFRFRLRSDLAYAASL